MKIPFPEVFADETKNGTKLKTSDYQTSGTYPIIDQGQDFIAGYTDSENGLYTDVPAIIFGDHTRVLKYVDFPFFLGADGAKILKARKAHANYRYLYYALKSVRIPDTGYNRHFKWLKEATVSIPASQNQEYIVFTLDSISRIISHRKSQLAKLDELVKCRFVELFGDIEVNPRRLPILPWNQVFHTTTGKLDANAMEQDGIYPFFTCAKESYRINSYAFDCEALLLAGNNAAGVYDVKHYKGKFNAYQRTYVLKLRNENWSYLLFKLQLENKLTYMQSQSKGTNTRYLTMGILNEINFIIPSVEEQQIFADFVHHIDKLRFVIRQSLDETQKLFDSLMQEYFD